MPIKDIASVTGDAMLIVEQKDGKDKIPSSLKKDKLILPINTTLQDVNTGEITIKEEPEDEEPSRTLDDNAVVTIKSEPDEFESGDNSSLQRSKSVTPYKCHHCGLEWDKFNDLRKHIKSKHIPKRLKYKCHYCSFRGSLLIHLKKHTKEKHAGAALLCCPYCYYQTCVPYCLRYHVINKHLKGNCNEANNENSQATLKSEPPEIESDENVGVSVKSEPLDFQLDDDLPFRGFETKYRAGAKLCQDLKKMTYNYSSKLSNGVGANSKKNCVIPKASVLHGIQLYECFYCHKSWQDLDVLRLLVSDKVRSHISELIIAS
ncbi:unnamed protein product [Nezara viridula]|uniref:C2H2-type domain-containing protein n=1 Tax=Nezara viridula TaxID=85310 RepID=A0A9P0HF79_NEZVI|nr:unnamed protein product [Nezara viridula]